MAANEKDIEIEELREHIQDLMEIKEELTMNIKNLKEEYEKSKETMNIPKGEFSDAMKRLTLPLWIIAMLTFISTIFSLFALAA